MAKAIEDTLFYRSQSPDRAQRGRGRPEAAGTRRRRFHAAMAERATQQPRGLSATATHDTKRGEDARARLYAISEAPEDWGKAVGRWRGLHAGMAKRSGRRRRARPGAEWLIYQALLGVWPIGGGGTAWLDAFRRPFPAF